MEQFLCVDNSSWDCGFLWQSYLTSPVTNWSRHIVTSYLMFNAFWPCKFIIPNVEQCSWVLPAPSDLKWPRHAACKQAISAASEVPHIPFDSIVALIMLMVRRRDWKVLLAVASYWPHQLPGVDASSQLLIRVREAEPTAQPVHTSSNPPISLPAPPAPFSADLFPFAVLSKAAIWDLTVTKEEKDAARARAQN